MGRYIQGDDGKMKGSIGSGKSAIPSPQFLPRMLHEDEASGATETNVFDLWEQNRRRHLEEELLNQVHDPAEFPSIPAPEVGNGDIVLIPASDATDAALIPVRVTETDSDTRDFVVRFSAEAADGAKHDIEMKYPHTVPLLLRNPANGPWPPPYWAPERTKPHEAAEVFDEYDLEERRRALRTQTNSLPDEQEAVSNLHVEDVILIPSSTRSDYQWIAAEVVGIRNESPYTAIQVRDYFGNEQEFSLSPDNSIGVVRKGRGHPQEGWPSPGSEEETRVQAFNLRRGDVIELDSAAPGGKQMIRIRGVVKYKDISAARKTTVGAIDRNGRTHGIVFDMDQPLDVIQRGPEPEPEARPDPYAAMADAYPETKFPTPADFFVDVWSFLNNLGKPRR